MRKMLVAMAKDLRVLIIKLSDRLHNMRTIAAMPAWKQERTARETIDIYAPLAHRLGMQEVRQELEDLSFAALHPKRYAEIDHMVSTRSPEREIYLTQVLEQVRERLGRAAHQRGGHRPPEAPLLHLREDGRQGPGVRRHLRPRRHPRDRRLGEGLLRRARLDPRHLEAGAGSLQGLRGDAEVQPLPVAAHDGGGPAGQAPRGADPHLRDARPRRAGRRRPLAVQGRRLRRGRRHRLAEPDRRLAARDVGSRRVHEQPEDRPRAGRGLRLHAQGQGGHPRRGRHADRLRLRHPHRGGPRLHRGPGQRSAGAARLEALLGRRGRDLHLEGRGCRAVARLGPDRRHPAGRGQDPPVVLAGAP